MKVWVAVGETASKCDFDPSALLCKGADSNSCPTGPQVSSLKALYAGPHTKDGRGVNPGEVPGTELGFTRPICSYPRGCVYSGAGDRNDAASYLRASPK